MYDFLERLLSKGFMVGLLGLPPRFDPDRRPAPDLEARRREMAKPDGMVFIDNPFGPFQAGDVIYQGVIIRNA